MGYHLKDTVPDHGIPEADTTNRSGRNSNQNSNCGNNPNASSNMMQDFLAKAVRREMGLILREMMTPRSNLPQIKEQTGQDYLWALLGKNLPTSA